MNYTRRDVSLLLSALAAAPRAGAAGTLLPSRTYSFESLPVEPGENRLRHVFDGETHAGVRIELHESDLPPGGAPHPPHRHVHEEMILIREGLMEVTIAGRTARLGPGSVAYVASNQEHGWRNVGAARANYFVLAIGRDA
ncbi:MAG TPA: cupin domain-containing protein [Bryobacteraceae bacterium]|nr:cupin domain-containing protein [Bryobacteraceae bacterium]